MISVKHIPCAQHTFRLGKCWFFSCPWLKSKRGHIFASLHINSIQEPLSSFRHCRALITPILCSANSYPFFRNAFTSGPYAQWFSLFRVILCSTLLISLTTLPGKVIISVCNYFFGIYLCLITDFKLFRAGRISLSIIIITSALNTVFDT